MDQDFKEDGEPVAQEPLSGESPETRLENFNLGIATGMLESLGLNMYTSIGKSLSEFVANAFDADATDVRITIPFDEISKERTKLRDLAKAEVESGLREKFTVLVDPLPNNVRISIADDGHGMSPTEIRDKLLIVSRNRRKTSSRSESGQRHVMGRKGLGKLAGFGTAERVTIRSKRAGMSFATEFTMDFRAIETVAHLGNAQFEATYIEGEEVSSHGTVIILESLRCDSLKAAQDTVRDVLAQNFAIQGADFSVFLNDEKVVEVAADYEFVHPPEDRRDKDGYAEAAVVVNEMFSFPIKYFVRFQARDPADASAESDGLRRGSLPTALRGARIYCHGRLAAGPTLLSLHTGMHNFHSQAYMECIVHADEVDKQLVDHIGTNRADLKGDSELVEALREAITEIMRVALYEHSKFRDGIAAIQVENDPGTKMILAMLPELSPAVRDSSKKLLQTLASKHSVNSELYRQVAPLLLQSMNAGEVLARMIALEHDPKSIPVLAHNFLELAKIENSDVLKLYRGRRRGIEGLRKLVDEARANWKKGKRFENDLHALLKENPWLIGPEFSRYLTSDKPLGDVALALTEKLKVDHCAPAQTADADGEIADQDTRPDLVFFMTDSGDPSSVVVVELKTPNYPLKFEHLTQLRQYMMHVEEWLQSKYGQQPVRVRGYLIGDVDPSPQAVGAKMLSKEVDGAGELTPWRVIPLPTLLETAKTLHLDAISVAEANEKYLSDELNSEPVTPAKSE